MPHFMDYESLRAYFMGAPIPPPLDDSIKIQKFYPNIRNTEISDISNPHSQKSDEIMTIFDEHGKLWKNLNFHEVKLKNVEKFSEIFETLKNVTKMKILNCEVAEELDDEILLGSKPLPSLKDLEVSKIDWRIFQALKNCARIETLKLTAIKTSSTSDFDDFLGNCRNLKNFEVYAKAKDSFDTNRDYIFNLESLNIDRSDIYNARNEQSSCEFGKFLNFIIAQRKSLKTLKFKGKMSEREVARIAKDMKLKEINVHLNEGESSSGKIDIGGKNRELEKLTVIGNFKDVEMMLKYFEGKLRRF